MQIIARRAQSKALYEAAIAAVNGLPFEEALAALTINPARILGLEKRVGSLEKGKDADLVLFNGDPLRILYAKILDYSVKPGQIKYEFFKITQGGVEDSIPSEFRYMIFELSEDALWTLSDSVDYPERQYLKINAYRNTWKNQNFKFYFDQLYKSETVDCNDNEIFETYEFQENKSNLKLVTINPKYPGGTSALQKYFDENLILSEKLDDYFGVINISFKVNCDCIVEDVKMLSPIFPKTANALIKLVEKMPAKWIPAHDKYKQVSCYTKLKFIVSQGKIEVGYR